MKKLILAIVLALPLIAQAQQQMKLSPLTANVVSNIITAAAIVDNMAVINATTNSATIIFYDHNDADSTNYVQAAYTSYTTYATNYNVVFTNATGVLVTNTFAGLYTAAVSHSASTNQRPVIQTLLVPASSVLNKDLRLQVIRGLLAVPDQDVTLTTTYRNVQ